MLLLLLLSGAALTLTLGASGCAAPASASRSAPPGLDPDRLRTVRSRGFAIVDDGSLEPRETEALLAELASARPRILGLLGPHAAPGDFRPRDERLGAACAPASPADSATAEVSVVVLPAGGRCHADESGITLMHAHVGRRDATHELVHWLAGGSWRPIDEGLAVYVTEKLWGPASGVSLDVRARVYLDLGLDAELERSRLRRGMDRRDYDLAGSFVQFLVLEHGWGRFLELYAAPAGAFQDVYGVSEQELRERWRARLRALPVRQDGDYYRFKTLSSSSEQDR